MQVHGGMGYIEETAAQHFRDARIAAIYEGTNASRRSTIMRKLPLSGGAVRAYIGEIKRTVAVVNAAKDLGFGATGARLSEAAASLERTTDWLLGRPQNDPDAALAGATPYLRLFAMAAGGALLAEEALAAARLAGNDGAPARIAIARFFAENLAVQAGGLERAVLDGADSVNGADAALSG